MGALSLPHLGGDLLQLQQRRHVARLVAQQLEHQLRVG